MSQSVVVAGGDVRHSVNTDVVELALEAADSEALGEALRASVSSPYENPEKAIPEALKAFQSRVPGSFLASIERFVVDPGSLSALHIRNLPIDRQLPDTPPDGMNVAGKKTFVSEGVLMGIGRLLGHPFAFKEEKRGQLIHQICPVKTSEQKLSNEGSKATLGMHIENSFSEFRPHYLLLLCLRGDRDHGAMTRIAAGSALASRLNTKDFGVAKSLEFKVQCPASFATKPGEKMYSPPIAIFSGEDRYAEFRIDLPEYTECLTERASETYAAIQTAFAEPGVVRDFDMQPGDAVIVNNRKATHGRTIFQPKYDGQDRWLQRMYTISDPWQMRSHVDARLRVI